MEYERVGLMELMDYIDFAVFFILLGLFIFIVFSQTLSMLHRVYIILHLSFMHWALLQFASKATESLGVKFVLVQTSYLVLSTVSVIYFIFAIYVTNKTYWFKTWKFKLSLIPALCLILLVLFNPNGLFLQENMGQAKDILIVQGKMFNILPLVSFFYIVVVYSLLIYTYRKLSDATTTKRHISFALIGISINCFFAIMDYILNLYFEDTFEQYFPFITIGMLISACFMTFRINRNNVLNIISLAHRDVVNTMSVGILVLDRDGYIVEMNKHIYEIVKFKVGTKLDFNYIMNAFPHNNWKSIMKLYDAQKLNRYAIVSYELLVSSAPERHSLIQCHPIFDGTDAFLGYMYTVQDVTQMKSLLKNAKLQNTLLYERNAELIKTQEQLYKVNKQLKEMAETDPLTGCYNRRHLIQFLEKKLRQNLELEKPFSVLIIDFDHFKLINDKYGHLAGDTALRSVALKLQNCLMENDVLARFGGEEFIIYMDNINEQAARKKIEYLKREIQNHEIRLEDSMQTIKITVSIGVVSIEQFDSFLKSDSKNLQYDIIALADYALYEAKNLGRNTIVEKSFTYNRGRSAIDTI